MSVLRDLLSQRILLLDGAFGTRLQQFGADESLTRGDMTVLNLPDTVRAIHGEYLDAGADIISTCTFNAQSVSLMEYGLQERVEDINLAGARLARKAIDDYRARTGSLRPLFVAGSMGPTTKLLSLSSDPADPAARDITFDTLEASYFEQASALIRGGVDILLIETVLDPCNCKAALSAAMRAMETLGTKVELMVSATVTDSHARLLSGQSIEAFAIAMSHAPLLSLGLNCSMGAEGLTAPLRRLADVAQCFVSVHPNAGLPNEEGGYDDTPERMAEFISGFLREKRANIIGGCCGTEPEHIRAMRSLIDSLPENYEPRRPVPSPGCLQLSGLDPMEQGVFVNVGERCNVAGSRKFLRLISEGSYDEALDIARRQVEDGAMVIDVNMDDGLLDAPTVMTRFLNMIATDEAVARVPVMIDSSDFDVILSGLKCLQGKGVVNSISLKEGEEVFLSRAREIRRLGAAVVVMAFDEQGQAVTFDRKIEICARAYRLLTENAGFPPEDIIFDPNVLTVATGMEEHLRYALDFVLAARWIRRNLPGAGVSGGLSNLSFAFRGNNPMREAIHAAFLARAVSEGLSMAIMNPSTSVSYSDIPGQLLRLINNVLFDRCDLDSTEALIASQAVEAFQSTKSTAGDAASDADPLHRLRDALVRGSVVSEQDISEARTLGLSDVEIVSGPLMEGMNSVGRLFGEGKLFLPQVVKTARAMKQAIGLLFRDSPAEADAPRGPRILIATVKGDVHDIGKNIVAVVLRCNGYHVDDLGVMVPPEEIIARTRELRPDFICLSGLITPSLSVMADTLEQMRREGISVPVMIGGAATSPEHTALRLAPAYAPGLVVHVRDASQNPLIAARLKDNPDAVAEILAEQERLRAELSRKKAVNNAEEALRRRFRDPDFTAPEPPFLGVRRLPRLTIAELIPLIDRPHFLHAWKVKPGTDEALQLQTEASDLLNELSKDSSIGVECVKGFFRVTPEPEAILFDGHERLTTPRQHFDGKRTECLALCDYINPQGDYAGAFAATVSTAFVRAIDDARLRGDDYRALLLQTLGDRLVEAAAELMQRQNRDFGWMGIRPAVGYPSMPDQRNIHPLARLLDMSGIGITVTEIGAMAPASSVAGIYIPHPRSRYFNV